jgi:uncharacterized protein (DUF362 family)
MASATGLLLAPSLPVLRSTAHASLNYFGLHPFIDNHPDAVFIMRTNVDVKTNGIAKKQAGYSFGKSVFVPLTDSEGGFPLSEKIAIKPNLTERPTSQKGYTIEKSMGIVTDAYFVEGVIESMKELGLAGEQFFIREVNAPDDFADGGYWDMADRTGADLRDMSAAVGDISESDLVWKDVPQGVWFNKIPYLWPVNAPDTFLLNISKFKAHGMGLTLCAKNIQGSIAHNYQAHCTSYRSNMNINSKHMQANAKTVIMDNYLRHCANQIPRWDRPTDSGGLWMETWASRCLDNNSVTKPNLHIVEGIYGRDGNFLDGPGPGGFATDYMTNILLFGKNPFYVDIVGHWLGGHEPGNFGLFHMAIERGLSSKLDPMSIPFFEWKTDGSITQATLSNYERTPLKTYYLQRDYNGQSEPKWHMVNEAYQYPSQVNDHDKNQQPRAFILNQNFPNPFNPTTSIEYFLPHSGNVRLDILNARGEIVDRLADGYCAQGSHCAQWRSQAKPSGAYFYRLSFEGYQETKKMMLVR